MLTAALCVLLVANVSLVALLAAMWAARSSSRHPQHAGTFLELAGALCPFTVYCTTALQHFRVCARVLTGNFPVHACRPSKGAARGEGHFMDARALGAGGAAQPRAPLGVGPGPAPRPGPARQQQPGPRPAAVRPLQRLPAPQGAPPAERAVAPGKCVLLHVRRALILEFPLS